MRPIILTEKEAKKFYKAIDNPPKANKALKGLLKRITNEVKCQHCKMDTAIRNLSGYCDHLYYPEYCKVCNSGVRLWLFRLFNRLLNL